MKITIEEGKSFLRLHAGKGVDCPCCGQYVRIYRRKFNTVMARTLIRLYSLGEGYHHVSDIVKGISNTGTNDFSKLQYWGLITEMPKQNDKARTSGHWTITPPGMDFVTGKLSLPGYAVVYNKKCIRIEGDKIDISGALGRKFNYQELMSEIISPIITHI